MYCPKCGNMVGDNINFCPNCGADIRLPNDLDNVQNTYQSPTSNNAILGFVFSIIGIFTFPLGLFVILGLVLSIIGLNDCKKGSSGTGLAAAGLTISILFFLGFLFFWILIIAGTINININT